MLLRHSVYYYRTLRPTVTQIFASNACFPADNLFVFMPRQMATAQAELPKLPVPPLRQTLTKFLAVAKPLVSAEEFKETEKLVFEFGQPNGEGEKLQKLLEQRAKEKDNWLSNWWLNAAYLDQRCPLIVNVSPGLSFPKQNFHGLEGQLQFASRLIVALLQFKKTITDDRLPQDFAGAAPLDMSQYKLLFGTCRIPGVRRDQLRYLDPKNEPKHIVVAYKGHFFSLPVIDENGKFFDNSAIGSGLAAICEKVKSPAKHPVGLLTSENRAVWGQAYKRMLEAVDDPMHNTQSLEAIESSLFLICIDDPVTAADGNSFNEMGRQMLHGGGSKSNSRNRWFDKCLQFVIGYDGSCGLTYEHSPAEGPPVATLMDYCIDYIKNNPSSISASDRNTNPIELNFTLSPEDVDDIEDAAKNLDALVNDVDLHMMKFEHFGKNVPKSQKLSPDSFIQLALQLTFNKLHKHSPATYETGTLRRFYRGRTDTIRLPSVESDAFVHAMLNPNASQVQRAENLRKAVIAHKDYTAAACSGNGIDRHLVIAVEHGLNVPKLLMGTAYQTMLHFKLSTSQVAAKHDACMMFGPMYPDCYGICYNPHEKRINLSVTAFNSFPETSAKKFATVLEESLLQMQKTCNEGSKANL